MPLDRIERVVRITTADDPAAMLASPLIEEISRSAPGITIVFKPWQGQEAVTREILDGATDIAIAVLDREIENVEIRKLLDVDYVVAMRRGHPAAAGFTLDAWLAWPHVVVSGRGDLRTPLDAQLAISGRRRRVGLTVSSFQLVPRVLAETDLIAMLPQHSVAAQSEFDLVLHQPPVPVDGFPLHITWHARQNRDAAVQHVVEVIRAVFRRAGV